MILQEQTDTNCFRSLLMYYDRQHHVYVVDLFKM